MSTSSYWASFIDGIMWYRAMLIEMIRARVRVVQFNSRIQVTKVCRDDADTERERDDDQLVEQHVVLKLNISPLMPY